MKLPARTTSAARLSALLAAAMQVVFVCMFFGRHSNLEFSSRFFVIAKFILTTLASDRCRSPVPLRYEGGCETYAHLCDNAMNDHGVAAVTSTICPFDYHAYALGSIVELDNDILEHRSNAIGSIADVINAHCIRIDNCDRLSSRGLLLLCRLLMLNAVWLKHSC